MTTAKKMIQVASKYIGVKGTDNIFNTWYWGFHCYDPDKYPWCAAFQSYVAKEAGLKCEYSCSASGFATQFERIPVEKEDQVCPGDIVVFNWNGRTDTGWCDHVGLVEWSTIGQDGKFGTIEGNTTNVEGGAVARVTRTNWGSYFTAFFRPKYDASPATTKPAATTASSKKLYGIDVSSNQPKNICALVAHDFAIVKMSGNPQGYAWNYVNPYAKQQADDASKKSGRVAFYHFTYGKDANTEADFFVEQVKKIGYLGKCVMAIDYEAEAVTLGRAWVKKLADRIKAKTGQSPIIYASGSVIVAQKLFELGYEIWCANYYRGYEPIYGYNTNGCVIYSGCENSLLWQYTSQGFLDGYDGALDCNVLLGNWPGSKTQQATTSTVATATPTTNRFRLSTDPTGKKWLASGRQPARGKAIRWIAAKGFGKYRVFTLKNGWLPYVGGYDVTDLESGCAGDGSPILAVEFRSPKARYAVRILNREWYPDMVGRKDTGGSSDHFAGDLANYIDGFRVKEA